MPTRGPGATRCHAEGRPLDDFGRSRVACPGSGLPGTGAAASPRTTARALRACTEKGRVDVTMSWVPRGSWRALRSVVRTPTEVTGDGGRHSLRPDFGRTRGEDVAEVQHRALQNTDFGRRDADRSRSKLGLPSGKRDGTSLLVATVGHLHHSSRCRLAGGGESVTKRLGRTALSCPGGLDPIRREEPWRFVPALGSG